MAVHGSMEVVADDVAISACDAHHTSFMRSHDSSSLVRELGLGRRVPSSGD